MKGPHCYEHEECDMEPCLYEDERESQREKKRRGMKVNGRAELIRPRIPRRKK